MTDNVIVIIVAVNNRQFIVFWTYYEHRELTEIFVPPGITSTGIRPFTCLGFAVFNIHAQYDKSRYTVVKYVPWSYKHIF